ncbi:MAG TPA: histidine phosphatase family protein [Xanthomonadales bacterium]|nr:histidine phosphatase family protein [Xanthomonadales bacterium]
MLIRHGQASFGQSDYDALSPAGVEQAKHLGEWLARGARPFDAVLCGRMRRHRDTLAAIADAHAHAPLRTVGEFPALDEFDHEAVMRAFAETEPSHPHVVAFRGAGARDPRTIYAFLRSALEHWADGRLDARLAEPWHAFCARIERGVAQVLEHADGCERVLVVTSGGVMAQFARVALGLSGRRTVALNLSIRNSGISTFHARDGALELTSWNALPHLADESRHALWTYY